MWKKIPLKNIGQSRQASHEYIDLNNTFTKKVYFAVKMNVWSKATGKKHSMHASFQNRLTNPDAVRLEENISCPIY